MFVSCFNVACFLQELCQCRPSDGNCSCCKECMLCLGNLWEECCDCVGECNVSFILATYFKKPDHRLVSVIILGCRKLHGSAHAPILNGLTVTEQLETEHMAHDDR